jgi:hypothetical protein
VFDTCTFLCLSPWNEKPTFNGESINNKLPNMFQGKYKDFGIPFNILIGPISVKAPNWDPLPGPPCNQTIKGIVYDWFIISCEKAPNKL